MNTRHYLRLLRTFTLAALTAAATAACSDDIDTDREPLTPPDDNGGIPVTFTANISPGSDAAPAAAPDTRTILTPTTEGGFTVTWKGSDYDVNDRDFIYIWAAKGSEFANEGNAKDYWPVTSAVSSVLQPMNNANPLTLPSQGEWAFTALYGTTGSQGKLGSAVVSSLWQSAPGNTEHIARNDFSVATAMQHITGDGSEMPNIINFKFEHKLSALQLRVTNQSGEELTVKEIRLFADGGPITRRKFYDVAMGNWQTGTDETSDYLQLEITTPAALPSDGTAQDFHMLLFPGYANTDMTITVITDRGEYTLTKTAPASPGFEAGHNYMTNITIKTDGLTDKETWRETISNKAELIAFRDRVNNGTDNYQGKTVYLAANIDLANASWTPIGNNPNFFKGTFDGGGYHISNLSVDNGSNSYAGLFGWVEGGTVRNLRVSGTVTTTGMSAGGIVGYFYNSTVENCIYDGDVSGVARVGGIAGYSLANSRIAGCHTKGTVTTTYTKDAGGIAGCNGGSAIDGCYSEAEVKGGYQSAGGIAGSNEEGGTVTHCYATGKVSSKNYVGGIVGFNDNSSVTGCIALNPGLTRTSGTDTKFGRVAGNNNGGTVTSCAAFEGMAITDANGSFTGTGEAGAALTREQCVTGETYPNYGISWDSGWNAGSETPLTYLPWNKAFESFPGIQPADYRISVPDHLKATVIP